MSDTQAMAQAEKRLTRFSYRQGPMYYIGQKIVRKMQDAGHPAKIHTCFRSSDVQNDRYLKGFSKAAAWQSPHQYYLAVDIIHDRWAWFAGHPNGENGPEAKAFWAALEACAKIVAEELGVELDGGFKWRWDLAHIELEDWRELAKRVPRIEPNQVQLDVWFAQVLPDVWKQFQQSKSGERVQARRIVTPRRAKWPSLAQLLIWIRAQTRG